MKRLGQAVLEKATFEKLKDQKAMILDRTRSVVVDPKELKKLQFLKTNLYGIHEINDSSQSEFDSEISETGSDS